MKILNIYHEINNFKWDQKAALTGDLNDGENNFFNLKTYKNPVEIYILCLLIQYLLITWFVPLVSKKLLALKLN